jgi:uridine kinase
MLLDYESGLEKAFFILQDKQEAGRLPIILIDGRAASGKSTFALELAAKYFQLEKQAARVISMDDLYPGWEGLSEGSIYLLRQVLMPLSQGKTASWQIWDWKKDERSGEDPMNGHREFSGGTALIIEGCGSISRLTSDLADLTVWIESDDEKRKQRFNQRDEGKFDEYYGIWSTQEDEFYERENSRELSMLKIRN